MANSSEKQKQLPTMEFLISEKKEGTFISMLNRFEFFYIQLKKVKKSRPLFDDLMTTFVLSKIKNGNFHLHNLDNNKYKNIESAN